MPIGENVRMRLRSEEGFGLVELLISMVILNVALLAIVAAFNSGAVALQRSGRISTATALGNAQMELYRALKYGAITLDSARVSALTSTDNVYSCDAALKVTVAAACGSSNRQTQVTATCTGSPLPNECEPSRALVGPDNHHYRVDSYIVTETPPTGRQLKKVTIVVRDGLKLSASPLVRIASTFDASTGS